MTRFVIFTKLLLIFVFTIFGCEERNGTTIDSQGTILVLASASILPTTVNTDTINIAEERKPDDQLKIRTSLFVSTPTPTNSVRYSVQMAGSQQFVTLGTLADDGQSPDVLAGDGIWSTFVNVEITRVQTPIFYVETWVEDQSGFRSSSVLLPLKIVRANQPPILSDLQAPSTIQRPSVGQTPILLQVRATDPDGDADIRRVIFSSFRPSGAGASGNPFQMFDDGDSNNSGDQVRGDGIYTRRIVLSSTDSLGTYRFEFQAFDRSNAVSNTLVHFVTVIQ